MSVLSPSRLVWADNLKVALVAGVVVAHATMAWADLEQWVLEEPPVREPLLSLLQLATVTAVLFAMPLFFLVAGLFTPPSLERKGARRFVADRAVRLLLPMLAYMVFVSPVIEWVDPSGRAGWTGGFLAFVPYSWTRWPPVEGPGPTWFLGVLFVFSVGYALLRSRRPAPPGSRPLRVRDLVVAAVVIAVVSYVVRLAVPLGAEWTFLLAGQAPAWGTGFALGAVGRERGWFPLPADRARWVRWTAWASLLACVGWLVALGATGLDIDPFLGGGTGRSAALAALEGVLVVGVSLWLVDVFQRRAHRAGAVLRAAGRAAFAAFLLHQLVLVGLVLAVRQVPWPPEVEYLTVAVLGVVLSFAAGAVVVRVPGVDRVL